MPKVSVIVPNYNHSQFLSERLDSIINQTYKDFELIILDDASTDNSIDVINQYLNKYPELIRFQPSTNNSGSPFVQWDNGIKLAKGEFVWIAESDDVAPTKLFE
jgi:glycosyltransferase involved in cell wall biosynthesis